MKSNFKWPVVVLIFLLTFTVIYAVSYWRQLNLVEEPLREKLLKLENIEDVNINNSSNKIVVNISLTKVDNLPLFYRDVEEIILSTYEEDSFKIFLIDKRTPYLSSLYEKIHYLLMEGERLGNYSKMNQEVSSILEQEQDLEYFCLWVDQEHIYLLLSSDNDFLCEIIPIRLFIEPD